MKKRIFWIVMAIACLTGWFQVEITADAKISSEQKREYKNALSQVIREGRERKRMDIYAKIAKSAIGKELLREAVIENRAALMAEGIDFLDSNWDHYYIVKRTKKKTVFQSSKMLSRETFQRRYQEIMSGLQEVLSCLEPGMSDGDKAMAVYYYLTKNTAYEKSADCHTGYDVLVNHTGVCDGLANAYALAMNTIGIPCAVVSSYSKDHSWNIVQIDGIWYLCDLTSGSGTGEHEGMVVTYSGCLVGVPTFLSGHSGYTMQDIYGEGNSDGLDIRSLALAEEDYIPNRSAIRLAIASKPCLFYERGYWYWVSVGNILKRSRLNGEEERTVYQPADDEFIGWAEEYDGLIYISLNERIYQMDYDGRLLSLVKVVSEEEYVHEVPSYFWRLAYVGRFHKNEDGSLGYYVTDLRGAKKGISSISTAVTGRQGNNPYLSEIQINLRAGYGRQLYVMHTSPENIRALHWTSSDPTVVAVDETGYVEAKKRGMATITASVNGVTATCSVKVDGYTITYKRAGKNSPANPATASGKKKIRLKTPKKPGYVFEGWYDSKKYKRRILYIRKGNIKNMTVYARWRQE